jgi:hypothetical protein
MAGRAVAAYSAGMGHDHGYKLLFSHAEMVRDLLIGFVDEPWVAQLRFETLQRVSASRINHQETQFVSYLLLNLHCAIFPLSPPSASCTRQTP